VLNKAARRVLKLVHAVYHWDEQLVVRLIWGLVGWWGSR
jgi:hypothetical protein